MIKFSEDERLRPTPEDIRKELREAFWQAIDRQMEKRMASKNEDKGEKS